MHRGTDRVETRPERHSECVLEAASGPDSTSAPTFLPDPAASAGSAECCDKAILPKREGEMHFCAKGFGPNVTKEKA